MTAPNKKPATKGGCFLSEGRSVYLVAKS